MNTSDITFTTFIIFIFILLFVYNFYSVGTNNIKNNWAVYRCNPMIMPFAGFFGEDVTKNFTFCIQNMQTNYMGELLKPVDYNMNVLTSISGTFGGALESIRGIIDKIRNSITNMIETIMSVFLNILIEFQKVIINMKDSLGKVVGILATLLYTLDGSQKTMTSIWKGPPGKMVKAICFHENTLLKLDNNECIEIKNVELGSKLKNGSIVEGKLILSNLDDNKNYIESLYEIESGENNSNIYVTGSHLIWNNTNKEFEQVEKCKHSKKIDTNVDQLYCLITSDHIINIGSHIFHDWQDNQN